MSTSKTSGLSKMTRDKNQRILLELVSQPGNDVCADCKAKAPRWASHNLGIFICVHCASIHRKIGTHITKVKSLTLDDWTKEQVENMKAIGNIKANQYWNPDEKKHPLPTNMEESERDSELEKYIRSKYEFQRFRPLSVRAAEKLGPSQSLRSRIVLPSTSTQPAHLPKRSQTAPIRSDLPASSQTTQTQQPPLPGAPSLGTRSFSSGSAFTNFGSEVSIPPRRSSFNPFPANSTASPSNFTPTSTQASSAPPAAPPNQQASLTSSTFNDLISIQTPSLNSSLPLQYTQSQPQQGIPQAFQTPMTTGLGQSAISTFGASPFGNSGASPTTNPYASLSAGGPFSSPTPGSNIRGATLPFSNIGQSPLGVMPTGTPNAFQQPQPQASFNPFTPMQIQAQAQAQQQQYPGTPLASNPSPSPFFTPQVQTQQTSFQPGGVFQSPANSSFPMTTQAQQAQQIFQGMAAGGGAGSHNPFAQWGGT
ncbi:GTS1 [Sanghuangporus sanghuang]